MSGPAAPDASQAELAAWQQGLKERALRLLARREHSRHELADKLLHPRPSPSRQPLTTAPSFLTAQQIQACLTSLLDHLEAKQLLSDERFAEILTRQYLRKGKGPLALQQAYQQHQLDTNLTQPLLDDLSRLWQSQANRVREKRFGNQPPASPKEAAKMQRFLASRGFTGEQIRKAVFQK